MADNGRWLKLWCSAMNDPSLDALDISDFGRWVKLAMLVKEQGHEGAITLRPPSRSLQSMFQVPTFDAVLDAIKKFPNCTLRNNSDGVTCNVSFSNWQKYQVDTSTARVRKFRLHETAKKRGEEKRGEYKLESTKTVDSSAVSEKLLSAADHEWPAESRFVKSFLETQTLVNLPPAHLNELQNPDFWERTSEACGGIDLALLQAEFAKMGLWLVDNPSRKPTPRGIRRFVSSWFIRAYERERRYGVPR